MTLCTYVTVAPETDIDMRCKSNVRQVPDHQEVFAGKEQPISLIVELAQYVDNTEGPPQVPLKQYQPEIQEDINCFDFHVRDLSCSGKMSVPDDTYQYRKEPLPVQATKFNQVPAYMAEILFTKPGHETPTSQMFLLLIRLKEQTTDLLVSLTVDLLEVQRELQEKSLSATDHAQYVAAGDCCASYIERVRETLELRDPSILA